MCAGDEVRGLADPDRVCGRDRAEVDGLVLGVLEGQLERVRLCRHGQPQDILHKDTDTVMRPNYYSVLCDLVLYRRWSYNEGNLVSRIILYRG